MGGVGPRGPGLAAGSSHVGGLLQNWALAAEQSSLLLKPHLPGPIRLARHPLTRPWAAPGDRPALQGTWAPGIRPGPGKGRPLTTPPPADEELYAGVYIDFMGTDAAIFRTLGKQTAMRTDQHNSRWLNGEASPPGGGQVWDVLGPPALCLAGRGSRGAPGSGGRRRGRAAPLTLCARCRSLVHPCGAHPRQRRAQ